MPYRDEYNTPRLLIEAPPEVEIVRNELLPGIDRMEMHPSAHRFRHLIR